MHDINKDKKLPYSPTIAFPTETVQMHSLMHKSQGEALLHLHRAPEDTVLLRVASTVSCTAAVHVYAPLPVT